MAGACTSVPTDHLAPATAIAEASGPALEVGQGHRYTLDWRSAAPRTEGRAGVSGALTLQGELAVAAIGHGPEGTRVSAWPERSLLVQRFALRKYHFQGAADPALVERARLGQYNDDLHRAMASMLIGSRDQPEVLAALASLAQRSTDRQLAADLGLAP